MNSARHLALKTTLSALTLVLAANSAALADPTSSLRRPLVTVARPAAAAHTFSVLHTFSGADGSAPEGSLDLAVKYSSNSIIRTIYGETEGGGSAASGTIYAFTLGPSAFTSLYSFSGGNDGGIPYAGLANNETNYFSAGATQVGVAITGGADGQGTLFAIGANGQPTIVHTFSGGTDGADPSGRLTQFTDGDYYGTTSAGGAYGFGTVFKVTSSGQFSTIYAFTGGADGGSPQAGLALRVNTNGNANVLKGAGSVNAAVERAASSSSQYVSPYLYGTTSSGASCGVGTIFRITPAGKLQTLHVFSGKSDGGIPAARLSTDLNGNLYGTTTIGGSGGNGVIFKIPSGGTASKTLYDFGNGTTGADPQASLTLAFNGNLYGTAFSGGTSGEFGSVFEVTPSGTFTDIYNFAGGNDGGSPEGTLLDGGDGNLYGTTTGGGAASDGVLFAIAE